MRILVDTERLEGVGAMQGSSIKFRGDPTTFSLVPLTKCELCGAVIKGTPDISLVPHTLGALMLCRRCTVRFDTGTDGRMLMPDTKIVDWAGDFMDDDENNVIAYAEERVSKPKEPRKYLFIPG